MLVFLVSAISVQAFELEVLCVLVFDVKAIGVDELWVEGCVVFHGEILAALLGEESFKVDFGVIFVVGFIILSNRLLWFLSI